ncbi:helix-turn-helix domain-containing protein [Melioribacter sp. Ez-97]|uniref:helix-turn-helix domain-containing protein n=1 Tax=Melioribacter sp. Ez-97 TaxID=3423434 RepID=UPI003EDAF42E
MAKEALKKFAEELKSLREEKGFTLQQISSHTRIDINFLKQLEEGNFDVLPEIYIKAFIREYADFIGLNPEEVVKKYHTASKGKLEELKEEPPTAATDEKKELPGSDELFPEYKTSSPEPFNKKYVYVVIGAVAAIFLIYFLFLSENKTELSVVEPETSVMESKSDRFELDSSVVQKEEQVAVPEDDSLHLYVETTGTVWIKVVCDTVETLQKIVSPNTKLNFKAAEKFYVAVGNAAYVKMKFNGKPVEPVGEYAEVRNYFISPDTIRSYLIPVNEKNENKSSEKN